MNMLYQLASSASIISLAIAFALVARRVRPLDPQVTITSYNPKVIVLPAAQIQTWESCDELAMQILITNGIDAGSIEKARKVAAQNGLVYWSNMGLIHAASAKTRSA